MPDEWRKSILVPIYKNKGDIQSCTNYRGIKLMCHIMKLWERVIEQMLRHETTMSENQLGLMPWEVDNGSDLFIKETNGKISR